MRQYKLDLIFKDMKKVCKQFTVNHLLNPEKWTRPKVSTERSQMNNTPSTDFMGAVYCAFAVNFFIFTKQTYTQICCLICFSAL